MGNACPPKRLSRFQSVRWLVAEKSPDADFYFKCLRPYNENNTASLMGGKPEAVNNTIQLLIDTIIKPQFDENQLSEGSIICLQLLYSFDVLNKKDEKSWSLLTNRIESE